VDFGEPSAAALTAGARRNRGATSAAPGEAAGTTLGVPLLSTGRFVPKPRGELRVAAPIPVSPECPELGEAAGAGAPACRDAELCEATEGELGRRALDPATTDEGAGDQPGAAFDGGGGGVTEETESSPFTWAFADTVGAAARRGAGGAAGSRSER